ncbi:putative ribonuclease H-like domain-containing protein [Tanacetum coccineum]
MKKIYCLVVTDDYSRFTWVFFLATKDETSGILKSFINGIEKIVDYKVKVIRYDNGTEFKNREMNQFCKMKGILRQFSVARTPQQNRVAEWRNRTLIEATKTMLADSKTPTLSFIRPFGCPITILNTKDHLGIFDGKADEGFFVGYSLNSKAFRVFNNRTRIVEENLHIRTKASDNKGLARKETEPVKNYILLPLWTADPPYSQDPKSSYDDGSKPSNNVNSTNNVNATSTNEVNIVGGKTSIELLFDLNMPALEDYSTFDFSNDDKDDGAEADMNNLDTTIQIHPIPTTRIHKDHLLDQEELLQFKLQEVWTLMDLPIGKRVIGSKWVFRNKKDERGIVIKVVAQGYTQEEGIDYDEVFASVARIEAIRLFLAYASFKDFVVHKGDILLSKLVEKNIIFGSTKKELCNAFKKLMHEKFQMSSMGELTFFREFTEVKTAITLIETQKPLLKDENGKEVDVHMYRSMIGSLMYLTSSRPDIMFAVCACARYQSSKGSHRL